MEKIYNIEFKSDLDENYKIEIFDRSGSVPFSVPDLIISSEGFVKTIEGSDESNPYQAIFATKVEFNVSCKSTDTAAFEGFLEEIVTSDQNRFHVIIKKNTVIDFRGNILPDFIEIPDDAYPNFIKITATDGLGILKDIEYKADENTHYNNTADTLLNHIFNCIDKTAIFEDYTGNPIVLRSYFNWKATGCVLINNSLIESMKLFYRAFQKMGDDEITVDEAVNCYDVLKNILDYFSARIIMIDGIYTIIQNHVFTLTSADFIQYCLDRSKYASVQNITFANNDYTRMGGGVFRFLPPVFKTQMKQSSFCVKPQNLFNTTGFVLDTYSQFDYVYGNGGYECISLNGALKTRPTFLYDGVVYMYLRIYIKINNQWLKYDAGNYTWVNTENYVEVITAGTSFSNIQMTLNYTFPSKILSMLHPTGDVYVKLNLHYRAYDNATIITPTTNFYDFTKFVIKQDVSGIDIDLYKITPFTYWAKSKKVDGSYSNNSVTKNIDDSLIYKGGFFASGRLLYWTGTIFQTINTFTRQYTDQSGITKNKLEEFALSDLLYLSRKSAKIYEGSLLSTTLKPYNLITIDGDKYMLLSMTHQSSAGIYEVQYIKITFDFNNVEYSTDI